MAACFAQATRFRAKTAWRSPCSILRTSLWLCTSVQAGVFIALAPTPPLLFVIFVHSNGSHHGNFLGTFFLYVRSLGFHACECVRHRLDLDTIARPRRTLILTFVMTGALLARPLRPSSSRRTRKPSSWESPSRSSLCHQTAHKRYAFLFYSG